MNQISVNHTYRMPQQVFQRVNQSNLLQIMQFMTTHWIYELMIYIIFIAFWLVHGAGQFLFNFACHHLRRHCPIMTKTIYHTIPSSHSEILCEPDSPYLLLMLLTISWLSNRIWINLRAHLSIIGFKIRPHTHQIGHGMLVSNRHRHRHRHSVMALKVL